MRYIESIVRTRGLYSIKLVEVDDKENSRNHYYLEEVYRNGKVEPVYSSMFGTLGSIPSEIKVELEKTLKILKEVER